MTLDLAVVEYREEESITDVTQQELELTKRVEASAIHKKHVVKLIGTTGFSVDNDFSLFGPLTTQF